MPAGAVEHHDGVLVLGEGLDEAVEEDLHGVGVDRGQDQREGGVYLFSPEGFVFLVAPESGS